MAQMSSCCIQWLNRDPNPPYPYLVQLLGMSFGTSILEERKEPIGNRGCDRRDIPYCFLSPLSSLPLSLYTQPPVLCILRRALGEEEEARDSSTVRALANFHTTTSTAAVAAGMAATAMACTQLAAAAAPAVAGGVAQRSRFYAGSVSHAGRRFGCSNGSRVSCMAEWLPGQPRPPYLDGSAPGYVYGSQSTTATSAY